MTVTVIVPFHRNLEQLRACLAAIRRSTPQAELVVAADGAIEDYRPLLEESGARVVEVPGPSGPAVARNRAAAVATGQILVFVDTDVVVAADAIAGLCSALERDSALGGVFGAYDLHPPARNFMSQFKNLSHAYVHEVGNPDARTFWAGLGAVRAEAFRAVGGFDERFGRPSVEDIELGYRLAAAGYGLRLDPRLRGTHLKRWTLWNAIVTDIRARGIPWTQLIHRFDALANDLNTSTALRLSVVVSYLILVAIVAAVVYPWSLAVAAGLVPALVWLNLDYYRWLARQRGRWFGCRAVGAHWIHHLCNGVSFVAGTAIETMNRIGVRLPGALPLGRWPGRGVQAPLTPGPHHS